MSKTPTDPARPIVIGEDVELSNFVRGVPSRSNYPGFNSHYDNGAAAATLLLAQIEGVAPRRGINHLQDNGRKFLVNPRGFGSGGCAYIDMGHLELCIPEVTNAFDYVAASRANLELAKTAASKVNAQLSPPQRVEVLANNTDGEQSWGSHISSLISSSLYQKIFQRHDFLVWLASFKASAILFAGAGMVRPDRRWSRSETGASYHISQRAGFMECLTGVQTTYYRPMVNGRDESLCGDNRDLARLHDIFFDNTLCQVGSLLKTGVMQLVLADLESGIIPDFHLLFQDPVDAARRFSADPSLKARAPLLDGRSVTCLEHQSLVWEHLRGYLEGDRFEPARTPRAAEVFEHYTAILESFEKRDLATLATRVDWVLKQQLLENTLAESPGLDWHSPEIRMLDQRYASLDESTGLFFACENAGALETVVSPADIARLSSAPPEDTRAFARAKLLALADRESVASLDWDHLEFSLDQGDSPVSRTVRVHLDDPLGFTRSQLPELDRCDTLDEAIDYLADKVRLGRHGGESRSRSPGARHPQAPPATYLNS